MKDDRYNVQDKELTEEELIQVLSDAVERSRELYDGETSYDAIDRAIIGYCKAVTGD